MPDLQYDVFLSRRPMMTRDVTGGDNEDLRWVANSATFIYGEHDAVLADTFLIIEENERLIGWVKTPEPRPEPERKPPSR